MINKKGWSLKEELILMGIIIIFLIIAIFFIVRMYSKGLDEPVTINPNISSSSSKKEESTEPTYQDLENSIKIAAITYYEYNFEEGKTQDQVIKLDQLVEKKLLAIPKDLKDNTDCTGYAIVRITEDYEVVSVPYLKCSNYKTQGYQDWR